MEDLSSAPTKTTPFSKVGSSFSFINFFTPFKSASKSHFALSMRYCTIRVFLTSPDWRSLSASGEEGFLELEAEVVAAALMRLGAHTMDRFLEVMPVVAWAEDTRCRWCIRYSRVLEDNFGT